MVAITLRADLTRGLTNEEIDANFTNLNTEKMEKGNNLSDLVDDSAARSNLDVPSNTEAQNMAIAMAIALG